MLGVLAASVGGAFAASSQIVDPAKRAAALLVCAVFSWLVGYMTPPPRRNFRRGDP